MPAVVDFTDIRYDAGCVLDAALGSLNVHESVRAIRSDREKFMDRYETYLNKYAPSAV